MPSAFDPAAARALAERLIAIPSASPDREGEARCASVLLDALPRGVEHGEWPGPDGRPVAWAFLRGRTSRAVMLLGHVDTVGADAYAALGAPDGERIAFAPAALRERLLAAEGVPFAGEAVTRDLEEEREHPGTWMFGRGALDMKSGLAAGVAALHALAETRESLAGSVLFVATPDEERESSGMIAAVERIERLRAERGLEFAGAINLDYAESPAAYSGVMGKLLAQLWVRGVPTHAAAPFQGVDAIPLAAAIVARVTRSRALVDRWEHLHGPPAVALRLRDLKPAYNLETAAEAVAEIHLQIFSRPLAESLHQLKQVAIEALDEWARATADLGRWAGGARVRAIGAPADMVLTWPELLERAGLSPDADPLVGATVPADAREATLARLRRAAVAARLAGPTVVIALVPPYYPAGAPRDGRLERAAATVLEREGIDLRAFYPYVSDAAYLAWRTESAEAVARWMPSLGREYRLPSAAAEALDLDVVNLGPWGRDAHGLFERVHAPWAFDRLPRLVAELAREAVRGGE